MANQYQNFVRAQMKTREAQLRNQTIQEDERRSRNIALGQMIATGVTQAAGFRKGLIEDKFLGKTTETGEKMYEYADTPDSTLGLIKRKLMPGQKDFKFTKAGEAQESMAIEVANAPQKSADAFNAKFGFKRSTANLRMQSPKLKFDSVTDDNAKTPILNKTMRKIAKPAMSEAGVFDSISGMVKESGVGAGVNPNLTQSAINSARRGKGVVFDHAIKNAGVRLSDRVINAKAGGKAVSSGIGLHSGSTPKALDILNNKTTALSAKATGLADSTESIGGIAGKAGNALSIVSAGMSAKDLITGGGGKTGQQKMDNRLGASYDLISSGAAAFGGPVGVGASILMQTAKAGYNLYNRR
ncbi:MAG: hypothetical protein H8D23_27560 [Candidatus Brocadiales bacterium]|nr:hypothetical protein [Candidatus Brocadiales bacterium]